MKTKTSRTTKSLLLLSFLFLASIIGINIYEKLSNTPKKVLIEALTSLKTDYNYLYNNQNNNYNFLNNDFTYNGKISSNIDLSFLDFIRSDNSMDKFLSNVNFLNNLNINYTLSKNDKELLFNINNSLEDNKLNFSYYINADKHYLKLEQFSNNYIEISNIVDLLRNKIIYIDDQNYLLDFIIKSFINNLDDNYFHTSLEKININNEELNCTRNTLVLDRKNITEILNKIIIDLKKDDKAKTLISSLYPYFNDFNIIVSENRENDIVGYFNTYTNNNNLVKYELELSNLEKILNNNIDDVSISFLKDKNIIELFINKEKASYININKKENGYSMNFYLNDSKLFDLSVNNLDNEKNISITAGILANNNLNLSIKEILDRNTLEEYDKLENKISLDFNCLGFNIVKTEITNTANIYHNSNIDIKLEDVKQVSDLNNEDYIEIKQIIDDFINYK